MSDVLTEKLGRVFLIRFNHPSGINCISGSLPRDIVEAFDMAAKDDDIHAVVTVGEGRTYFVGGDLNVAGSTIEQLKAHEVQNSGAIADFGGPRLSQGRSQLDWHGGVGHWIRHLRALEKPTVAALNGATGGAGLSLACHHDYRILSRQARLTTAYLDLGVAPEHGASYVLPRLVGWRIARDLLMRPRPIDADEALSLGLVDQVVSPEAVLSEALTMAEQLASYPSHAMQLTKRLLARTLDATLEEQLDAEYRCGLHLFERPETHQAFDRTRLRVTRKTP